MSTIEPINCPECGRETHVIQVYSNKLERDLDVIDVHEDENAETCKYSYSLSETDQIYKERKRKI